MGGHGGCQPRIEVIVKMPKKSGVRSGGVGLSRVGGCDPRIEVIVKIKPEDQRSPDILA